ncbi:hypothetical protein [Peribacillus frigoritolerans]|uniref:hypothetical protein n=1 Tax=Peribacillus frigoritolerans TaxID=450367 RepID=UPI0020C10ADF|nr:hypothetical protein [Peribacillus frigoritolerans]
MSTVFLLVQIWTLIGTEGARFLREKALQGETPQADRPLKASAFVSMLEFMDSLKDKLVRMAMVNWKVTPNQKHYSKRICKETFLKNRDRIIMSTAF